MPSPGRKVAAVVFDLDGTLVDSSTDLAAAANRLLGELGVAPLSKAAIVGMVGEGAGVLVRRALTAAGLDPDTPNALARFLEIYDGCLLEHTRPYDGTIDMLERLRRSARLGVLTNKPARATARVLDGLGLSHYLEVVVGGDSDCGRKPDPAGLRRVAGALDAPTSATVMVGDSPVDLQTARNAGTRVVLARFGFGFSFAADNLPADARIIDRFADLPGALGLE